jgi:leader peptidase (prepilin peptidase)/N-methyltransferase
VPVAAALAVVTFVYLGHDADSALWAVAQIVLVVLAAYDVESRRLPNLITLPAAAAAIALRTLFERSALVEILIAGFVSFAVFFALAALLRGGLGMGDVKLAGMLGFLLGRAVLPALAVGVIAGGIWGGILLATGRADRRTAIAYGPFLALGGALAILFSNPPALA